MSNIAIKGAATGTGVFTLESPATNTNRTLTLPDEAGTILTTATAGVPIGGPAFSAYANSNQPLSANTTTKLLFQVEEFDTNSNFASSTFTPTVAGYYQINARMRVGSSPTNLEIYIYKNGSAYKQGNSVDTTSVGGAVNSIVYCNGSTDYIDIYGRFSSSQSVSGTQSATWVNGAMVRSAT